jgi:sigma-E factor negative regulatory protein RseC
MLEKNARVLHLDGDVAVLHVAGQSACDHCAVKSGCGTSVLARWLNRNRHFRAWNLIHAQPGSEVIVAVPEHTLVRASLLLYVLPIVLMILGAAAAQSVAASSAYSDAAAAIGGVAGLVGGFLGFRWFGATLLSADPHQLPVVKAAVPRASSDPDDPPVSHR